MIRSLQFNSQCIVGIRKVGIVVLIVVSCLGLSACQKDTTGRVASIQSQEQSVDKTGETTSTPTVGVLTGKWSGKYYYKDGKSVEFSGTVQQNGENISGQFTEPRTTFGPLMEAVTFTLTGTIKNNQVILVKTYSYNTAHTVNYTGIYYPNEKKIQGQWSIEKTTGTFEITIAN